MKYWLGDHLNQILFTRKSIKTTAVVITRASYVHQDKLGGKISARISSKVIGFI